MWSDGVRSTVAAVGCLCRRLPLFFRASPQTPLRVLGIIALDTLSVLRDGRRLSAATVHDLALFLDFEGCINARWDQKAHTPGECDAVRCRLEAAGHHERVATYLEQLGALEHGRPAVGGDRHRFHEVRTYREEVARLALTTAADIALRTDACDVDVDTLFRTLMQCQIIDDVLDYAGDITAGLPSFLTASASLAEARTLASTAARDYGAPGTPTTVFPLRVALMVVTMMTRFVLLVARR